MVQDICAHNLIMEVSYLKQCIFQVVSSLTWPFVPVFQTDQTDSGPYRYELNRMQWTYQDFDFLDNTWKLTCIRCFFQVLQNPGYLQPLHLQRSVLQKTLLYFLALSNLYIYSYSPLSMLCNNCGLAQPWNVLMKCKTIVEIQDNALGKPFAVYFSISKMSSVILIFAVLSKQRSLYQSRNKRLTGASSGPRSKPPKLVGLLTSRIGEHIARGLSNTSSNFGP